MRCPNLKTLWILIVFPLVLTACGSDPKPFQMNASNRIVIGDAGSGSVQFLINPEEESGEGTLTAQIDQEFPNRRSLIIESLDIETDFPGIGLVRVTLNPNFDSTGTVYKLDSNNKPFGTHNMNLFLIVETPDQNLTFDNVELASDQATLELAQILPVLGFLYNGDAKELQILALEVIIPADLITSDEDPQ